MPTSFLTSPSYNNALAGRDVYARQLRVGFDTLRFEPQLEAEYKQVVIAEAQHSAIIVNIAATIIWFGFSVFDFVRLDVPSLWPLAPDIWVLLITRWLVLALLIICLIPAYKARVPLDWRAFTAYTAIGLGAALTSAIYRINDMPAVETMQIVVVMGAFLPIGLRFYACLAGSVIMVAATVLTGVLLMTPEIHAGQLSLVSVMLLAVPVAAVGGYLREHAHRRQFLLAAVLAHQAQFDPLTNLANRRLFERHASAAIAHSLRTDETLILAVLDIDHFKQFNDLNGHAAGDEALRAVAAIIADTARRPMDMAARLGGEEFALLLFGTDMARARPILETLRQRIAGLAPAGRSLTISIGATAGMPQDELDAIYRRADELLYRSKEEGRNRVNLA